MRPAAARARGFTLVELVMVLLILGIVAGTVTPAIRATEPDPLDDAAAEVSRLVSAARTAALRGAAPVRLTIDPLSRVFVIEPDGEEGGEPIARGTLALAGNVTMAGSVPRMRMTFGRTGFAIGDSVTLLSPSGARVIRVEPWSGNAASGDTSLAGDR